MSSDLRLELRSALAIWVNQELTVYDAAIGHLFSEPHSSCWCLLDTALKLWITACLQSSSPENKKARITWGTIVLIIISMLSGGQHSYHPALSRIYAHRISLNMSLSHIRVHGLALHTDVAGLHLNVGMSILRSIALDIRPLWLKSFWTKLGVAVSQSTLENSEGDELWHCILNDMSVSTTKSDRRQKKAVLHLVSTKPEPLKSFLSRNYNDRRLMHYAPGFDCLCQNADVSVGMAEVIASKLNFALLEKENGRQLSIGDWSFFGYLKNSRSSASLLIIEAITDSSDFAISMFIHIYQQAPQKIVHETVVRQLLHLCLPQMHRSSCLKAVRMAIKYISRLTLAKASWVISPLVEHLSQGHDLPAKFILPVISTTPGRRAIRSLVAEPRTLIRLVTVTPELVAILCEQLALEERNAQVLSSWLDNPSSIAFGRLSSLIKEKRNMEKLNEILYDASTGEVHQDILVGIRRSWTYPLSPLDQRILPIFRGIVEQCSYECIDPVIITRLFEESMKPCSVEFRTRTLELILQFVKMRPVLFKYIRSHAIDLVNMKGAEAALAVQLLAFSENACRINQIPESSHNFELECQELLCGFEISPQPDPNIIKSTIKVLYRWRGLQFAIQHLCALDVHPLVRAKTLIVKHTAETLTNVTSSLEKSAIVPLFKRFLPELVTRAKLFDKDALEAMTSVTLLLADVSPPDCQNLVEVIIPLINSAPGDIITESLLKVMQSRVFCGLIPLQETIQCLHSVFEQGSKTNEALSTNNMIANRINSGTDLPLVTPSESAPKILVPIRGTHALQDLSECLEYATQAGLWLHDFSYLLTVYPDVCDAQTLATFSSGLNPDQINGLIVSMIRAMLSLDFSLREMIPPFMRFLDSTVRSKGHAILVAKFLLHLQYCTFDRPHRLFYLKKQSKVMDCHAPQKQSSSPDPIMLPGFHWACDTLKQCLLLHCEGWVEDEELFPQDHCSQLEFPINYSNVVCPLPEHEQLTKAASLSRRLGQSRTVWLLDCARRYLSIVSPPPRKKQRCNLQAKSAITGR